MATAFNRIANTVRHPAVGVEAMAASMPDVQDDERDDEPSAPKMLDQATLDEIGRMYAGIFERYKSERNPVELRWLRNLRQYMGLYDPAIETQLPANRSRAYPRMTRTKCIALLSRIMNLMFPGNDKNWEITASPSPEMDPHAVADAVAQLITDMQQADQQPQLTQDLVDTAINRLAVDNAKQLSTLIEDQLAELGSSGGIDTLDWIALNRKVLDSGIKYGVGVLEGPYVREVQVSGWELVAPSTSPLQGPPELQPQGFRPITRKIYKPQFEVLPCWDFYPDMTSRTLPGEGYFVRKVMSANRLKKLRKRPDFQPNQIDALLRNHPNGNYNALYWETELRALGVAINADRNSNVTANRHRYEVIVWRGPIDATMLARAGVEMDEAAVADDVYVEMWMCAGTVIKLDIDPWRKMGEQQSQVHCYSFDEDDTSPIGQGLPYVMRDSQMAVCAATRMALDNASVVCGPQIEINKTLLDPNQDLESVEAYKVWARIDDGMTAQWPAVREINIQSHIPDLQALIHMFQDFAESETFVGNSTGGELSNMPSEPMRTMAGASMVNGNVALPFKDAVRAFDTFTQSVLNSLVTFNKVFNPDLVPKGDYNTVARGATSLIAKEVRGAAMDMLAQTMQPDERIHVDMRKFTEARFATRDLTDVLRPEHEVEMDQAQQSQQQQQQQDMADRTAEANIGKTNADAYKAATQGQKNSGAAQGTQVKTALDLLEAGQNGNEQQPGSSSPGQPVPGVPAGQ